MSALNFIGQAYENRSIPISSQKCVNFYPEIESPESRTPLSLQGVSGTKEFVDFFGGQINGMHFNTKLELMFVVANREVFTVSESGVKNSIGFLPDTGLVAMADNGEQVGFATGEHYYVYDSTGPTFAEVKVGGSDTLRAVDIAFLDGYFIIPEKDTQVWFISNINDGTVVDALDFAQANSSPDDILAVTAMNGLLWFLGENSYESWYNSGNATFPFSRRDSGQTTAYGVSGTFAKTTQDGITYWCSSDGRVYRSNGGSPQRISHHGIENSLRTYPTLTDCETSNWTENGHRFVAFSFPSGNQTWVFDSTSSMWHERATFNPASLPDNNGIWDSRFVQFGWNNRNIVGSRSRAKLGELDLDIYTEYGNTLKSMRTSPVIHAGQASLFTTRIELLMEVGRADQAEEPKVWLSWSDDGGVSYKNKVLGTLGKIGEYMHRIVWYRLGKSVNRVYKLEVTDDSRRNLIEVDAEIGQGWT